MGFPRSVFVPGSTLHDAPEDGHMVHFDRVTAMDVDDLFSVKGKTALVTGGSRGIGYMIAEGLLAAGARVYISSRKADVCDRAAEQLSEIGDCISIPANLASVEGCERLAKAIADREQILHLLVNNAGVAWGDSLKDYSEEGWDKVMSTNVKGTFFLTRAVLPLLRAAATPDNPARVINIGSVEGIRPPFWENFAYPASKAAIHMLTRDLAKKLAADHITINAIAPGLFHTKMTDFAFENDDIRKDIESHIPLGRTGRAEDIAGVATFLASRAGSYLTGTVIPVDGGIAMT